MCFKVFSALKLSTWALEVASHQPHNCIVVNVLCPAVWKIAWHFLDIFQLVLSTSWVLVSAHHCSALRITCSNWKKQILGTRANQSNLTQQSATQEAFWIFDLIYILNKKLDHFGQPQSYKDVKNTCASFAFHLNRAILFWRRAE